MNFSNPVQAGRQLNSYYINTANRSNSRLRLHSQISADVCVIGAGFSGLSSALHLAEKGYQVVVLEASAVGWGASGTFVGGWFLVVYCARQIWTMTK